MSMQQHVVGFLKPVYGVGRTASPRESMALATVVAGIVAIVTLLKLFTKVTEGVCRSKRTLEGKTVIITGANSGIGLETARDLARRNARVILACRNLDKANAAAKDITATTGNTNVVVRRLDLSSLSSVREFAKEILETEERLDVLIHNAGVSPPAGKHITEDGLELQFATNHFGPFLLNHLLLDLLKKSAPARIVVVSSVMHYLGKMDLENLNMEKYVRDPFWVYQSTKLANLLFTLELSKRLKGTGVTVNAVHPGGVKTSIARDAGWIMRYITIPLVYMFLKDARSGAQTTIYAAVSEEVEGISGAYFAECKKAWTTPRARDEKLAAKLWELSEKFTGIKGQNNDRR